MKHNEYGLVAGIFCLFFYERSEVKTNKKWLTSKPMLAASLFVVNLSKKLLLYKWFYIYFLSAYKNYLSAKFEQNPAKIAKIPKNCRPVFSVRNYGIRKIIEFIQKLWTLRIFWILFLLEKSGSCRKNQLRI